MTMFTIVLALSALLPNVVYASCPLLGASFPVPRNLSGSSIIQSALTNLTAAIQQAGLTGNTSHGVFDANETSFSIQIFDTKSSEPLFDFHNSAPSLANASSGVKTVDANTIYRIGSISKLFTVLTFLIEAGDAHWDDPVTDYIPELKNAAKHLTDSVNSVQWNDVTIGALASQMAGIARDYGSFGDLVLEAVNWTQFGLPALNASEVLVCGISSPCGREDFFKGLITRRPVFAPFTTPIYSNIAFQILAYVLEAITKKNFVSMLEEDVFKPLDMSLSSYSLPANDSSGVIPGNATSSSWNLDLGEEGPAGSLYSTSSDMTKFGRAILQSSLLSPSQTRRWMKPHSHTAQFSMSVGAPWEIRRLVLLPENRIIDIYTKSGDIGYYSSLIALIPEYDVGFNILAAGPTFASRDVTVLAGVIGDLFIPQLEAAARDESNKRFSGTYSLQQNGTNSTFSLTTEDDKPGFTVTTWTNNGHDILSFVLGRPGLSARLYPTNIYSNSSYAFRAIAEAPIIDNGPFSGDCMTWFGVDADRYGAIAFDDFIFQLGEDGNALSIQPRVMRTTLPRIS